MAPARGLATAAATGWGTVVADGSPVNACTGPAAVAVIKGAPEQPMALGSMALGSVALGSVALGSGDVEAIPRRAMVHGAGVATPRVPAMVIARVGARPRQCLANMDPDKAVAIAAVPELAMAQDARRASTVTVPPRVAVMRAEAAAATAADVQ